MSDWITETLQPNGTLKNKLGISDNQELRQKEYELSSINSIKILDKKPKINSINDLYKIHKLMFSDLYSWAGQKRQGNFNKNGYEFFDYQFFDMAEQDANDKITKINNTKEPTSKDYAELLDTLNYMHPFREGNGRSTKLFLECLAAKHGQSISYPRKNDEMIEAQNNSDINKLAKLINLTDFKTQKQAYEKTKTEYEIKTIDAPTNNNLTDDYQFE